MYCELDLSDSNTNFFEEGERSHITYIINDYIINDYFFG